MAFWNVFNNSGKSYRVHEVEEGARAGKSHSGGGDRGEPTGESQFCGGDAGEAMGSSPANNSLVKEMPARQ